MAKIIITTNPFDSSTGIDDRIHKLYYQLIESCVKRTKGHFTFWMWQYDADPDIPNNPYSPQKINTALFQKVRDTNCKIKINADVDFYDQSQINGIKDEYAENRIDIKFPTVDFKLANQRGSGTPKLHDKTILFNCLDVTNVDEIEVNGIIDYVVVLSSANIWHTQYSQSNNLVLIYGHKEIYDYYLKMFNTRRNDFSYRRPNVLGRIWNWISRKSHSPKYTKIMSENFPQLRMKAYSFPNIDIIEKVLENIITHYNSEVKIRLIVSDFTNKRIGKNLKIISNLPKSDVQIIAREYHASNNNGVITPPKNEEIEQFFTGTNVKYFRLEKGNIGIGTTRKIHEKVLIFEGTYKANNVLSDYRICWFGSFSYTYWAVSRNSETLIRIIDTPVYNKFTDHWNDLRGNISIETINP